MNKNHLFTHKRVITNFYNNLMLIIRVLVFWITSFFARVGDTLSYYPHTRSVGCASHTARLSTPRVEDTLLVIS